MTDEEINREIKESLSLTPHCSACTRWTFVDTGEDDIDIGKCATAIYTNFQLLTGSRFNSIIEKN